MHRRPKTSRTFKASRLTSIETLGYFEGGDAFFELLAVIVIVACGLVPMLLFV